LVLGMKKYRPARTLYNRFRRWAEKGIWKEMFATLADRDFPDRIIIDSTIVRAHRSASGGKGGSRGNASGAPAGGAQPGSTL
jgi:transposase